MVIPRLVQQALRDEPLTVYGDGRQTRCFAHVLDVIEALLRLLDDDAAIGHTFNIGSSEEISIGRLAEAIIARTESRSRIQLIPYDEAFGADFEDMQRRVPDTAKLRALTGWQPRFTLADVLNDAITEARREAAPRPDLVSP
jgi:UDP-glucose 4-epimerase